MSPQTIPEKREQQVRTIFEASPDKLADPRFIAENVLGTPVGSPSGAAAVVALQTRLAMDNERTLAALNTTVGQSGEASRKLQEAANGFARSTSRLTVFISVVAALQLWQIVGPSFLAWLRS